MHKIVLIEGGKRVEQAPEPKAANNTEWMLGWCRKTIPGFADMNDRALASKIVGSKAK